MKIAATLKTGFLHVAPLKVDIVGTLWRRRSDEPKGPQA